MAKSVDLVKATKRYKGDSHTFFLDLKGWRRFKSRYKLDWQKLPFSEANKAQIPSERGIYAFTVELASSKLPAHGYILYIGLAGDSSASNLQKRYGQYLRNKRKGDGRPRVQFMLDNWYGDLQFNFVTLPNPKVSLAKIESDFLNAIIPPINLADFSPELLATRKAAF